MADLFRTAALVSLARRGVDRRASDYEEKGALKNNGKKGGTTDGTAAGSGDEKSGCDGDLNAPLREEEKNSNEKNDHHTDGNGEK